MNYEQIRDTLSALELPKSDEERRIEWISESMRLGVARDAQGRFEVFAGQDRIHADSASVRHRLAHDQWRTSSGAGFRAARLLLPEAPHYLPTAAFIVKELIDNGFESNPQRAFSETEALIEMVIKRGGLGNSSALGLIGELWFLRELFTAALTNDHIATIVGAWKGAERTSRDFVFSHGVAVEVKTTGQVRSVHTANSISQANPRRGADGVTTESLFWLSLGLRPTESARLGVDSFSVLSLMAEILEAIRRVTGESKAIEGILVQKVKEFGVGSSPKYDHGAPDPAEVFTTPHSLGFARLYDLNSTAVQVIRREDVEHRVHTLTDSVSFQVALPDFLEAGNPRSDVRTFIVDVLGIA